MMALRFVGICSAILLLLLSNQPVNAQGQTRGLTISPVRQEHTVVPGTESTGSFIVGNSTDRTITVDLSVEQFSVADYSYDYEFRAPPSNDWVKIPESRIELRPNKTQKIIYRVLVPSGSPPGGYYFSLFASTTIDGPGLPGTVRAASLLYMKVDGKLVRTSVMENATIPFWITGGSIPYEFDVKNTGNVHFSAYFFGQIDWLFGSLPETGASHLLMPNAVRTVEGAIPTPLLPGIYKVTYGYKVDFADIVTTKTSYIAFVPPWSIVIIALLLYALWSLWKNRKLLIRKKQK